MASLAQTTKEIRLISKIAGAVILVGVVIFLFFQGGSFIQKVFFPKPPAPPEERFGQIPNIVFPETNEQTPDFRINTISGTLPVFSSQINIYAFKKQEANIAALKEAKDAAEKIGYFENQTALTPSIYSWRKLGSDNTLELDIIYRNFTVTSDYLTNPIYINAQALTLETSQEFISNFVNALGANMDDIDFGKTTKTFYNVQSGSLIESSNELLSQMSRLYFYQNDVDQIPIYYPEFNTSSLYFLTTFLSGQSEVIDASYIHRIPDLDNKSTYPLKTSEQAYRDLQEGKGYIVNPSSESLVDITDVKLGYYIGDDLNQEYLVPIIVFYGKNNFLAYVQALP